MGLHNMRAMLHQEDCRTALELLSAHRAVILGEHWLLMHALGAACRNPEVIEPPRTKARSLLLPPHGNGDMSRPMLLCTD